MKAILKAPYRKALAVVGMSLAASVALASYSGAAFAQDATQGTEKPAAAPAAAPEKRRSVQGSGDRQRQGHHGW